MLPEENQGKRSKAGVDPPLEYIGCFGPERAYEIARRFHESPGAEKCSTVVVVPSPKAAQTLIEDIAFFLNDNGFRDGDREADGFSALRYFPAYNISPFKFVAYHNQTSAERIRVLYRMMNDPEPAITVTTVSAILHRLMPRAVLSDFAELLMVNEEVDRDQFVAKLVAGGYVQTPIVEEPGDFCVRGGIVDIFTPLYAAPLRVEFFGDIVESIRFFSPVNQRSREQVEEAVVLPAKELVLPVSEVPAVVRRLTEYAGETDMPSDRVRAVIDRIRNEGLFPGIEALLPAVYPETGRFTDYAGESTRFVLLEPETLEKIAKEVMDDADAAFRASVHDGKFCFPPRSLYADWGEIRETMGRSPLLSFKMISVTSPQNEKRTEQVHCSVRDNGDLKQSLVTAKTEEQPFLPVAEWIQDKTAQNLATLLVCESTARADHLALILGPYGVRLHKQVGFPEVSRAKGMAWLCAGRLSAGFVWPEAELAILTDTEIFGRRTPRKSKRKRASVRADLLTYEDLKQGELVVHAEHGIGRYDGLTKLTVNGATNDFLLIEYRDGDRLYLPVDRMSMIQKYMGVEGMQPQLDKMGGASWSKVKAKVKASVEKMAGELLNIYAERKVRGGHGFHPSESDIAAFEAGFPFEETPDQQKAIDDVLADMASDSPMDRLICGDVGYGKTEVALRASFAAAISGKQVAILVPTTVLAEQHAETFSRRFEPFPVNVACLSRFRSPAEQKKIVEGLKSGAVDIVIGTHRILQKDIAFNDLGLIVVDEEQRFGVRHKERLKKLRSTVDVLALTATPIPRTLHLSLTGIRDISVISTPPENRRPVTTYISEYDDGLVADAIRNELRRSGQIFFVHNHIRTIDRVAEKLREMVPEVRLDIAHADMGEDDLEGVMVRFINREIDLLVCTTIIESGLDVPAANTILINRAERFGLSQIYQLRGRVGRADEQAYAYLFISSEDALTRDAQKRLKVLMEHSDLGAGFQIAMSDLKIRGGGAILGTSQSGHIAAVGYDMYLKLMEEAVAELKGEPMVERLEPEINMPGSAYISEAYIPDIDQRLTAYRRLTRMRRLKDISAFKAELTDRFGPLPEETGNLLLKIMLRILCADAGVRKLDMTDDLILLTFSEAHQRNPYGIVEMISEDGDGFRLTPDNILKAPLPKGANPLAHAKSLLKEISKRVNG